MRDAATVGEAKTPATRFIFQLTILRFDSGHVCSHFYVLCFYGFFQLFSLQMVFFYSCVDAVNFKDWDLVFFKHSLLLIL